MLQQVPALVVLEIISSGESILDRIESSGIQAIKLNSCEDLTSAIKRVDPDVLLIHLPQPSESAQKCFEALQSDQSARTLPVLALLASNSTPADLEPQNVFAPDDFITATTSEEEICWRLQMLSKLGGDRRRLALQESFEELITQCNEGVIIFDPGERITYRNPSAQALFSSQVNVGGSVFDLFDSDSRLSLQDAAGGPAAPIANSARIRVKLSKPRMPCYEAEAIFGQLSRNRKLLNLRLINTSDELDDNLILSQRLDVLGQLTGGLAHDLNNVLNAVIGGATLLELDAGTALRPQIQTILKTAKRGGDLLQQLLLFSSGSDKALESTDLIEIARECASIVADTFPRNIEVKFKGTPDNDFPVIEANAAQLHQIVMNLCVNARDSMPDGGEITITAGKCLLSPQDIEEIDGATVEGHYLTTNVRDSGAGIPSDIRSRIFEPFFSTKPKGKGTGLGLPTVVRLMQLHGGFVTINSSTEKGTSVTCYFPYELPH